jgi:KduI/IolB family.
MFTRSWTTALFAFPEDLPHPQVTAPGYAMHYTWMIRHYDNNPWTSRVNDPAHEWLLEENPDIWEPK